MSETTPPYETDATALSDDDLRGIERRLAYVTPALVHYGFTVHHDCADLLAEVIRLRTENALLRIARLTLPSAVTGLGEPVNCATATTVHVAGHPVPDRRVVDAIIADLNRHGHSGAEAIRDGSL